MTSPAPISPSPPASATLDDDLAFGAMSTRFVEMVVRAFSFLEDAGIRRSRSEHGLVGYASVNSFVSIT